LYAPSAARAVVLRRVGSSRSTKSDAIPSVASASATNFPVKSPRRPVATVSVSSASRYCETLIPLAAGVVPGLAGSADSPRGQFAVEVKRLVDGRVVGDGQNHGRPSVERARYARIALAYGRPG